MTGTLKPDDKVIVHYLLQPSIEATVVKPDEGDGWVECEGMMEIGGEMKGYPFVARVEMIEKPGVVKRGAAALRALRGLGEGSR